jgi:hypothetical protein
MRRLRHQSHARETCCLFGKGFDMGSVKMNCDCFSAVGAEEADDIVVGFIFASLSLRVPLDVSRYVWSTPYATAVLGFATPSQWELNKQ